MVGMLERLTKSNWKSSLKGNLSLISTKMSIVKDFHRLIQWCVIVRNDTPGCGCQKHFIEKARNNYFSCILSNSESAHEFAEALKVLPRHACDEHKRGGGNARFML